MKKKVFGAVLAVFASLTLHAQQIPGMDFDTWSKTGGSWYPYAKEAPASQRVWDSANKGLSLRARASHCGGFFCCGAQALGLSGFGICSTWAQWLQLPVPRAQAQ